MRKEGRTAMWTRAQYESSVAISALERISRKPWSMVHKSSYRTFVRKADDDIKIVTAAMVDFGKLLDPLWKPEWASGEYNPCDCEKCIAVRALHDIRTVP